MIDNKYSELPELAQDNADDTDLVQTILAKIDELCHELSLTQFSRDVYQEMFLAVFDDYVKIRGVEDVEIVESWIASYTKNACDKVDKRWEEEIEEEEEEEMEEDDEPAGN